MAEHSSKETEDSCASSARVDKNSVEPDTGGDDIKEHQTETRRLKKVGSDKNVGKQNDLQRAKSMKRPSEAEIKALLDWSDKYLQRPEAARHRSSNGTFEAGEDEIDMEDEYDSTEDRRALRMGGPVEITDDLRESLRTIVRDLAAAYCEGKATLRSLRSQITSKTNRIFQDQDHFRDFLVKELHIDLDELTKEGPLPGCNGVPKLLENPNDHPRLGTGKQRVPSEKTNPREDQGV